MREAQIQINVLVDKDLTNAALAERLRSILSGTKLRTIVVESVRVCDRYSGKYPQDKPADPQPTATAAPQLPQLPPQPTVKRRDRKPR